jgi:3',5'-cyclic AMP phosphodiesterase CpdA
MRIVLVSDTHLAPRATAFAENWTAAAAWIGRNAPDLVVNLGDITADGVSAPEELDAASVVFEALGRPMRLLPGNHDIGDNPLETGPSSEREDGSLSLIASAERAHRSAPAGARPHPSTTG